MKLALAVSFSLAIAAPAFAQESAVPTAGAVVKSADGRTLGRIDHLNKGPDGAPVSAAIIANYRFLTIPLSTLTAVDKRHFTTSLSFKDASATSN